MGNLLDDVKGGISGLVAKAGTGVLKGISDIADQWITTPQEKREFDAKVAEETNRHLEALAKEAGEQEANMLKDLSDARAANARIQETANASWMAKNVPYIIALTVVIIWGVASFYILGRMFKVIGNGTSAPDMTAVMGIYTAISGSFTVLLTFYFGSSQRSNEKDLFLRQYLTQQK